MKSRFYRDSPDLLRCAPTLKLLRKRKLRESEEENVGSLLRERAGTINIKNLG